MSRLIWDQIGEKRFETGVDHVVLYKQKADGTGYLPGVAWNGVTSISDSPDGAEATDLWADNIKYATLRSAETSGGTINAYTYPSEFNECNGLREISSGVFVGQQKRTPFALTYRTLNPNDTATEVDDYYKLHFVYGATVTPSELEYETMNDSPDAIEMSWEYDTIPVPVPGFQPTASITIESNMVSEEALKAIEDYIYGTDETTAMMPLPAELIDLIEKKNKVASTVKTPEEPVKQESLQTMSGLTSLSEIQSNIQLANGVLSGELKHKKKDSPWTHNYYVYLVVDSPKDATVVVKSTSFTMDKEGVTLDTDRDIFIGLDSPKDVITITVSNESDSYTRTIKCTDLVFGPAPVED